MIQISGGAMRFGPRTLFEGLDWLIQPRDRFGVVGANGSGKTTLLKILAGIEHLDHGNITRQKNLRIGYLPQDGLTLSGRSVFEECMTVFDEAVALEKEQEELAHRMAEIEHDSEEFEAVADRYQWITDRHHALDGYTKEAQVGAVLSGLGFERPDWERRTEEFSGGWQMRIALAKLLLEKPNLLLLDEPTNHLDLEARNWLEGYLQSYPNAFVLISHDRYFLDMTIERVVEIWNKKCHFYTGNFSKFEVAKKQRLEQLEAEYRNQQDHIHHLEVFINRFRYKASKAKQVQSRIKELDKIERIELPNEEKTIHFKFPQPPASGRVVAEFHGAAKYYGTKRVFEDVSFAIERGDRIALVGHNGAGKSTLIRMLAGIEPLSAGEAKLGHKVEIDYFAQDQYKALDPEAALFDDIARVVPSLSDTALRSLLGCFLFSGDDVFKRIGVLSGGERNRFALARMLVKPRNFLLLDEPTNHLDLRAKDVLLQALLDYTGTVVFVSHDRYFIDKLGTKVYAVGDGKVEIYPGNYEDYLWQIGQQQGAREAEDAAPAGPSAELQAALASAKETPNGGGEKARRLNPIKVRQMEGEAASLEEEIGRLEAKAAQLQQRLTASFQDHELSTRLMAEMEACRNRIERCEKRWEEIASVIEAEA